MSGVATEGRTKAMWIRQHREASSVLRESEILSRGPIKPQFIPAAPADPARREVRSWMRRNGEEYETATEIVEACNVGMSLPIWWTDDPDHWVWDEAVLALDWFGGDR